VNEDALRALVRATLARLDRPQDAHVPDPTRLLDLTSHPSQFRYPLPASDGPCIIEPGVACNHCGYCQSHGH
jgi:hypothetical protein